VLALGVWDDLRGVGAPVKLAVQALAGGILFAFGYGVPLLTNPIGGASIELGWLDFPLTLLWVVIVMNAINLVDGLDGLAAGVVLIASLTLWFVGRGHADFYVMFLAAVTAGATFGFLRFNWPPARLFLGDTGSLFLGLVMAAVSLLENRKGTAAVTLLLPLVAMGLPIVDSVFAFVRRVFRGKPVFSGDTEHIHHRLLRVGLSPRGALVLLYYVCAYLGVMAVVLSKLPRGYALLLVGLLAVGVYFGLEALEWVSRRVNGGPGAGRRATGGDASPPPTARRP
jgi:UDP-GlcNAc:undecaprenyl-phosphate GlcNAc-1-phosphate transferase